MLKNLIVLFLLFSCNQSGTKVETKTVIGDVVGDEEYIDSVYSFYDHLYPTLRSYCLNCHADGQTPYIASNDAVEAHDSIISGAKIDINSLENSRLYLRAKVDRHNCDEFDCDAVAAEILAGLTEWRKNIKESLLRPKGIISSSARISEGEEITANFNDENITGRKVSIAYQSEQIEGGLEITLEIFEDEELFPDLYLIKNITLESKDSAVAYSGLRVHINENFDPLQNKFLTLTGVILPNSNKVISNPGSQEKTSQMSIQSGSSQDQISISFERLQIYR